MPQLGRFVILRFCALADLARREAAEEHWTLECLHMQTIDCFSGNLTRLDFFSPSLSPLRIENLLAYLVSLTGCPRMRWDGEQFPRNRTRAERLKDNAVSSLGVGVLLSFLIAKMMGW